MAEIELYETIPEATESEFGHESSKTPDSEIQVWIFDVPPKIFGSTDPRPFPSSTRSDPGDGDLGRCCPFGFPGFGPRISQCNWDPSIPLWAPSRYPSTARGFWTGRGEGVVEGPEPLIAHWERRAMVGDTDGPETVRGRRTRLRRDWGCPFS